MVLAALVDIRNGAPRMPAEIRRRLTERDTEGQVVNGPAVEAAITALQEAGEVLP